MTTPFRYSVNYCLNQPVMRYRGRDTGCGYGYNVHARSDEPSRRVWGGKVSERHGIASFMMFHGERH